jgi:hypothetical protein
MELRRWQRGAVLAVGLLSFLSLAGVGPAEAFKLDVSDDLKIATDVTLTYGAAWRTTDANSALLGNINADDGNRNFKKWDFINNRLGASVDFDLNYKRDFGIFVRPRAYLDYAYTGHNANDSPRTNNNGPANGGPLGGNNDFMPETIKLHGRNVEILDLFAYSKFSPGEHETVLRVGRQVVNWGESLFLQGGISSATSPADATQANVPGVEVKDILLPVGQVYSSFAVGGGLTLAGFYQWEWDKTRLDESGSFFNDRRITDGGIEAGRRVLIPTPAALAGFPFPTVDRVGNETPKDSGQFGIAARYVADWLGSTEFGLYFVNYHDKLPQVRWAPTGGTPTPGFPPVPGPGAILNVLDNTSYHFKWQENIHLYGASFSTLVGGANIAGEVSYRHNLPVQVNNPAQSPVFGYTYQEAPVLQAQTSVIYVFGSGYLWNNLTLTAEAGFNEVIGRSNAQLYWDQFAWGYTARLAFDYFQILDGLDLTVPFTYNGQHHNSSVAGTFVDHADRWNIATDFTYRSVYKVSLGYTAYIGPGGSPTDNFHGNPKVDRDFLSLNLKYTF